MPTCNRACFMEEVVFKISLALASIIPGFGCNKTQNSGLQSNTVSVDGFARTTSTNSRCIHVPCMCDQHPLYQSMASDAEGSKDATTPRAVGEHARLCVLCAV